MGPKDVADALLKGISIPLSKHGFEFDGRKKYFRRETSEAIQIFNLLFTKKKEGIYVEPTIRIKIKSIEAVYHKVASKDPEYFDGTKTLGNNLFKIKDYLINGTQVDSDEKKSYLIENPNDIQVLSSVIPENFEEYALPYFDKNSCVSRADELLNSNVTEISVHNWLYPLRANLGIIAAKLNHNPAYYQLVKLYERELEGAEQNYKNEFEKLKNLLNTYT
jgi:hypothetical protein